MSRQDAPASGAEIAHRVTEHLHAAIREAAASEARAVIGEDDQSLMILRDVEQHIFEVSILLNAASLLRTKP
jgi:hypothetical protein